MDRNYPPSEPSVVRNLQAFLSGKQGSGGRRSMGQVKGLTRSRLEGRPMPALSPAMLEEGKRNRSANYSSLEKDIFLSAVQPYKHILEDKRFDSETLLRKTAAWRDIVSLFNAQHGVVRRDRKQLKELWKRLKDRARKSGGPQLSLPARPTKVINIKTPEGSELGWSQYPSLHALALASAAMNPLDVNGQGRESESRDRDQDHRPYICRRSQSKPEGEGGGRHSSRDLSPEPEDRKPLIPTPPPLKEHGGTGGHSSPPQSAHAQLGGPRAPPPSSAPLIPPPPPASKGPAQPEPAPPQQLLCVRWGNYDSNIVSMFSKLRAQEHFVDVTLWCEGVTIKCHKMVLSACSTYFETLLTENPNNSPIIFLKDMRLWEIEALVEFMYKGETSIHQDKLQSLLRAAESLQIKGLGSPSNSAAAAAGGSAPRHSGSPRPLADDDEDDELSNSMDMSLPSHQALSASLLAPKGQEQALNMGMDLSNHGGGLRPAKRRKKETPRRIDTLTMPRVAGAGLPLPLHYAGPAGRGDEDDGLSDEEEGLTIADRNHIDAIKAEQANSDQNYDESGDEDGPENFADNEQGTQNREEDGDSGGDEDDMEEEHGLGGIAGSMGLGGLTDLRIGLSNSVGGMNLVTGEGERERSRKGNPIKKIHLSLGNNNNNNDTGGTHGALLHNAAATE